MLAPRASSAFICMRCELRLARRRLPTYSPRTPHATFSTSARHLTGLEELESLVEPKDREPTKPGFFRTPGRIRRTKGKGFQAVSARLGELKRLGDDAKILVLKEVVDTREPGAPEENLVPDIPLEAPDLLAHLQEEHKELSPEEVNERLESLRPRNYSSPDEPQYVSQRAYVQLVKQLTKGFTQQQLSHYYSTAKNIGQGKVATEIHASFKSDGNQGKNSIAQSPWQPGITPLNRRLPGQISRSAPKRKSVTKPLLVDRILRTVWRLLLQEEVEKAGELEMQLKPWQLLLLSAGGKENTTLKKIAIERRVKMDNVESQGVLRITADKTTAEYAASDIEKALAKSRTRKLSLKPWLSALDPQNVPADKKLATLYTQEDFDTITSVTRASIQRMDNANTLVIRGLSVDVLNETERLLISLLPHKRNVSESIDARAVRDDTKSGYLLPAFLDEASLRYKDRKKELSRWLLPMVSEQMNKEKGVAEDVSTHSSLDMEQILSQTLTALHKANNGAQATSAPIRQVGYWLEDPSYQLSAKFGHALFDPMSAETLTKTPIHDLQPVFTPKTPGLARFFNQNDIHTLARTVKAPLLGYDFLVAPDQDGFDTSRHPPPVMSIRVRTDATGKYVVSQKIRLFFQRHTHTVLLPNQASDVRFSIGGQLQLSSDKEPDTVHEWLEAVKANILSGKRLTAPSLTLDIPKWTFAGAKPGAKGMQPVKYLFSATHSQQHVPCTVDEYALVYNVFQSNKLGARGGGLSLYHDKTATSRQALLEDESAVKAFLKTCFSVAEKMTMAAAQRQPLTKILRPRSENSERKIRRQAQQEDLSREEEIKEEETKEEIIKEEETRGTETEGESQSKEEENPPVSKERAESEVDEVLDLLEGAAEKKPEDVQQRMD